MLEGKSLRAVVWESKEHIQCECSAEFQAHQTHQRIPMRIKAQYKNVLAAVSEILPFCRKFGKCLFVISLRK